MLFTPVDPQTIRSELRRTVAEIMYQKKDGTLRKMRCTLMPSYLQFSEGTQPHIDIDIGAESNEKKVSVWDIENNGWRSFYTDRVISVQQVNSGS